MPGATTERPSYLQPLQPLQPISIEPFTTYLLDRSLILYREGWRWLEGLEVNQLALGTIDPPDLGPGTDQTEPPTRTDGRARSSRPWEGSR